MMPINCSVVIFITHGIVQGHFEVFHPAGTTRTDGGEIWHGRVDRCQISSPSVQWYGYI